ncbi:MAG: exodeoxyribonuclease VII small subunit [Acidimicrobiia bacterium]
MSPERPVEELRFEEARAELEAILAAIDGGDVDLDTLSAKVARAGALLAHCRARITATRAQIEDLVASFDEAPGDQGDGPGPAEEPF